MDIRDLDLRKAAILVASLDEENAELLLSQLQPDERRYVLSGVARLGELSESERRRVIEEFLRTGSHEASVPYPGVEWAGSVAPVPLDPPKPRPNRAESDPGRPFQFLRDTEGGNLSPLVADEHPQTIALVMAHLPPHRSAELLAALAPDVQVEVIRRLIDLDEADPETVREVERGLESRLAGLVRNRERSNAGLAAVTQILEVAQDGVERSILRNVVRHDRRLAGQLSRERLVCQDIEDLDDATLLMVFQSADPELGILALAGSSVELVDRVVKRLPTREARLLEHALENLGPTRLTDVEAARHELLALARQLDAEGKLQLPRRGPGRH